MKTVLSFLFLYLLINLCHAQNPVGYFYDVDNTPIDGFIDDIAYSPKTSLILTHNSVSFEYGSYYTLSGEKVDGMIKFENKKFWYKPDKASVKEKIRPVEVQSILVGIDSFFITQNFNVERPVSGAALRTKPEPVQFIAKVGNYIFAKHYNFSSGMSQSYAGTASIIETYLVKKIEENKWTSFPKRADAFKKVATKYFSHIPYLLAQIEDEELDENDMMTLIKTSEYFDKFNNKEVIKLDRYWQETNKQEHTKFTAKIISVEDSVWTLDYYAGDTKLATAQYTSFYPYRKDGMFKWYFASGSERKSVLYKNDNPKAVKLYAENGQLLQHYKRVKNEVEDKNQIVYLAYNDNQGNSLLDDSGTGIATIEDQVFDRQIVKEIKNFKIQKSYIKKGSKIIHQLTDSKLKFKFRPLEKRFNLHSAEVDLEDAAEYNVQGVILIYLEIGTDGYASNFKVLNQLHPKLDMVAISFLNQTIGASASFRQKFKPIKINKEKIAYELVIPITFGINRFYRQQYTPYYDPFWMQHQNMMFQNNFQHISPPPMPSFH